MSLSVYSAQYDSFCQSTAKHSRAPNISTQGFSVVFSLRQKIFA